jgi:alanine racemase
MRRGAAAEIDLDAIAHNFALVRKTVRNRPVIAVVKADSYGHGSVEVAKRLVEEGVSCLAVAFAEEGIELRESGVSSPILVLFDIGKPSDFFDYRLIPVIHDIETARILSGESQRRGMHLDIHVKVDTGMGRLGFHEGRDLETLSEITASGFLRIAGLMSHFSEADIADKTCAEAQLRMFHSLKERLLHDKKGRVMCHMANSAATVSLRDAHLDAVRPGLMLYGYSPFTADASVTSFFPLSSLRPSMKLTTQILSLRRMQKGMSVSYGRTFVMKRECLIAVLPLGYADGIGRVLSNNLDVLVRGKRAPVAGRICMDLTMVDVTEVSDVEVGDEVVLIGRQGDEEVTVGEVASRAGTIIYEILTAVGMRSRRIYRGRKYEPY